MQDRRFFALVLSVLTLVITGTSILFTQAAPISKVTDIVSFPLPSVPEPVLIGEALRVEVKAGSEASEWSAGISSRFGSSQLELINSSYMKNRWILYFQTPDDLPPELYDLSISFEEVGETTEYTQSRCVWLLAEWPDSILISHVSDLHMQFGKDYFAQYIHEVNLFDPDLIIATGDIVQTETVASSWEYLHSEMKWLEVPSFLVPGNHDYAGGGGTIYQQYGGLMNYSVVLGDFLFVGLDSHKEGQAMFDQIQWVESEIQKYPDKVKIMAWHYPLLSSEYEDDEGTVKGNYITGDWETIEDLSHLLHPIAWMTEGQPNLGAREMLRIIQEYDVRLILNGHVHRDMIYILNDRHYFVTVATVGGGLVPNMRHGSRLIPLDSEGNVGLDWYARDRIFDPPNNIPIEGLKYWYSSANDWTESAVTATIVNGLEMPLSDAKLEFHVSGEIPVGEYQFSAEPNSYEVYTTSDGHIFMAYYDVSAGGQLDVTLSSLEDSEPPEISLDLSDFQLGKTIDVTITVTDSGWGVDEIEAFYTNDAKEMWTPIELPFSPTINGDVYDVTYPEALRSFTIPAEDVAPGLIVKVEAQDHAGNPVTYQTADLATPPTHSFSVVTEPSGISITVDGDGMTAPYTDELEEGTHTVSVPLKAEVSGKDYTFVEWEDGDSSSTRTVSLEGDTSLKAIYEEEPEEQAGQGGIPMPTSYVALGLILGACMVYLLNKR